MINCHHCNQPYNNLFTECPFCGTLKQTASESLNQQPQCPRCSISLKTAKLRDNEIDICPECRGIWLDSDEFHFLTSERDVYQDKSLPRRFEKKPLHLPEKDKIYIHCPRCSTVMSRKNFKKISGVVIDICSRHGVWFDAGELEQVRSFVANVDLHEQLQTRIDLNHEDVKSLRRQLKNVELVQLATEFWNLKYWLHR